MSDDALIQAPARPPARDLKTSVAHAQAHAEALLRAGHTHAVAVGRDDALARQKMLALCRKPDLAERLLWSRDVGGGTQASGPSIRFAEEVTRALGHVYSWSDITHDDEDSQVISAMSMDLLTNVAFHTTSVVEKTVERKDPAGREVKSQRLNSWGKSVFTVKANESEMRVKRKSEESKILRDCILRLVPRDLIDDCVEEIGKTLQNENAKDPDTAKKKVFDRFATLGIDPTMLRSYMGLGLETLTPADIAELQVLFNGLRDREFSWADAMAAKTASPEKESPEPQGSSGRTLKERIKSARAAGPQRPQQAGEPQAEQKSEPGE